MRARPPSRLRFKRAWRLFLLWTGSFENLIIYAGVGLSIFSMLAMSSIYVLRWKRPDCTGRSGRPDIR